jgi:hypothetical protein
MFQVTCSHEERTLECVVWHGINTLESGENVMLITSQQQGNGFPKKKQQQQGNGLCNQC